MKSNLFVHSFGRSSTDCCWNDTLEGGDNGNRFDDISTPIISAVPGNCFATSSSQIPDQSVVTNVPVPISKRAPIEPRSTGAWMCFLPIPLSIRLCCPTSLYTTPSAQSKEPIYRRKYNFPWISASVCFAVMVGRIVRPENPHPNHEQRNLVDVDTHWILFMIVSLYKKVPPPVIRY